MLVARPLVCRLTWVRYLAAFTISLIVHLRCFLSFILGHSGVTICPVIEGYCELKALLKTSLHSRLLDSFILSLLHKRFNNQYTIKPLFCIQKKNTGASHLGLQEVHTIDQVLFNAVKPSYRAYMQLELGRDMRETVCRAAETPLFDLHSSMNVYNNSLVPFNVDAKYLNLPTTSYELPDGNIIEMNLERYIIPEIYFEPMALQNYASEEYETLLASHPLHQSLLHNVRLNSTDGIHKLIINSMLACDLDIQSSLSNNMVLFGGNVYESLVDKLKTHLDHTIYSHIPSVKVRILSQNSNSERILSSWLGGSIVASLGSLHEMWVSKKEYDEYGANVIDRKCP
jgi:actin-like protein 6A